MAEPPPPTILAIKQAFLEREARRLSQPLAPSRAWRRTNNSGDSIDDAAETAGPAGSHRSHGRRLPDKAVDDAVFRVNQLLRQHARRVYAPQAVRHVAEQIDQLYWQAGERAVLRSGGGTGLPPGLDLGTDFTQSTAIADLPPNWEDARAVEAMPMEARRYAELVAQLQTLSAETVAEEARVRRLQGMAELLAPLDEPGQADVDNNSDADAEPGAPIRRQDNVVTRNGPVERELERMRLLLARVGDRVAVLGSQSRSGGGNTGAEAEAAAASRVEDLDVLGQARVRTLLEQF